MQSLLQTYKAFQLKQNPTALLILISFSSLKSQSSKFVPLGTMIYNSLSFLTMLQTFTLRFVPNFEGEISHRREHRSRLCDYVLCVCTCPRHCKSTSIRRNTCRPVPSPFIRAGCVAPLFIPVDRSALQPLQLISPCLHAGNTAGTGDQECMS